MGIYCSFFVRLPLCMADFCYQQSRSCFRSYLKGLPVAAQFITFCNIHFKKSSTYLQGKFN